MKKKNNRRRNQLIFLSFLFVICILSSSMIFIGATVFRNQLPFFQLFDGKDVANIQMQPAPIPNPGVVNIESPSAANLYVVLGSDYRPESGFRTDTILLVAVDSHSGKASVVSFPRDLWVSIPGFGEGRINTIMQIGGFPLFANTLQTNFGVYPTQYVMIDMAGFSQVIDTLGGISFKTESYTADACDGVLDPDRWCEVGPGTVSLDSELALWYVRARYNSNDFDRMRRTQEVVKAVFRKVATPTGMLKIPQLMGIYESGVESNIHPNELSPLARFGLGFNLEDDVRWYVIGSDLVTSWTTAGGASVLLPNTPAIQAVLHEVLTFE